MEWIAIFISTLLLIIRILVLTFAIATPGLDLDRGKSDVIVYIVVGGGFVLLSLGAFVALVLGKLANRFFQHATEDVLPDVPREPLLAPGQINYSLVTHQVEPTASGIRLVPKPNLFKTRDLLIFLWMTFISIMSIAAVWLAPMNRNDPVEIKVLITVGIIVSGYSGVWIISSLWHGSETGLSAFVIDLHHRHCVLTCGKETSTVSMDKLVAVQLYAAYRKDAESKFPAVELNLMWKGDCEIHDTSDRFERSTVMILGCGFHRLIPTAQELEKVLGVPLLNHATPEHWKV